MCKAIQLQSKWKKKISETCIFSKHLTSLYKNAEEKCKPIPSTDKPSGGHALPFSPGAMIVLMLVDGFLKYQSQSIDWQTIIENLFCREPCTWCPGTNNEIRHGLTQNYIMLQSKIGVKLVEDYEAIGGLQPTALQKLRKGIVTCLCTWRR